MFTRVSGALMRTAMVFSLVLLPALILPSHALLDPTFIFLLALFFSVFIFFEYSADAPILIEFRDARPYNRLRFLCVAIILLGETAIVNLGNNGGVASQLLYSFGALTFYLLDFGISPLQMMSNFLTMGNSNMAPEIIKAAVGFVFLSSFISVAVFAVILRITEWPSHCRMLNLWVNLPTFEATIGTNPLRRLDKIARINFFLGGLLPFMLPMVSILGLKHFDVSFTLSLHSTVWVIALWGIIPTIYILRGLVLERLTEIMVANNKRHLGGLVSETSASSI